MQAVMLAAGRGSRMGELTESTPKPLLEVAGKSLLEHKLDVLPSNVDEVIVVVGYLGSKIHDKFGGSYKDKRLLYVEQEDPTGGTAQALWLAKEFLRDQFLVMNGDNIYAREDMARCVALRGWSVLVQHRDHVGTGRVVVDSHNRVRDISENSDHAGEAGYANTGLYCLDTRLFDYPPAPKAKGSAELGLPQTMIQAADDIEIRAVPATFWIEIKSPSDIGSAEKILVREA